ncbi:hypothetical protein [Streptomyces sp. NPDC126933]|uniref:hypothetical protein n=1 Tax=unclassified Streptomyces TaxID=2593676 RepID=UPI0036477081
MRTAVQHVESDSAAGGPVFVDASGRRNRMFRRVGWTVAAACSCYAVTLGGLLVGGSSLAPGLVIPAFAQEPKALPVPTSPAPAVRESVVRTPDPTGPAGPPPGRPWSAEPGEPGPVPSRDAANGAETPAAPRPGAAVPVTDHQEPPEPETDEPGADEPAGKPEAGKPGAGKPADGSSGAVDTPAPGEPEQDAGQPSAGPSDPGHPLGDLIGGVLGGLLG